MDRFLLDRLLFIPIAFGLGAIAWHFGFSYVGLGMLVGIALPIYEEVRGEMALSFKFGLALAAASVIGFAISFYFSSEFGLSFEELDKAKHLPKSIRRMPYYSVAALTTGMVIVGYRLLFSKKSGDMD